MGFISPTQYAQSPDRARIFCSGLTEPATVAYEGKKATILKLRWSLKEVRCGIIPFLHPFGDTVARSISHGSNL